MGRKKKRKSPKPRPANPIAVPPKTESGFRVLNRVACVECHMDKQIKPMAVCTKCQYHERDRCGWQGDRFRIKIVSPNEPMRFNRMAFSVGSECIRDESRNYYFITEIMQPTKCIADCPEYVELKSKLLSGELWEMEEQPERTAILDSVAITLTKTDNTETAVFFDNGFPYMETPPVDVIGQSFPIKFYLYDMYSMGGLSDVQIDGRFYKVRRGPIEGAVENMVMVQCGDNICIGVRRKEA